MQPAVNILKARILNMNEYEPRHVISNILWHFDMGRLILACTAFF